MKKYATVQAITTKATVYQSTGQETPKDQFRTLLEAGIRNERYWDAASSSLKPYVGPVLSLEFAHAGKVRYFQLCCTAGDEKSNRLMDVASSCYLVTADHAEPNDSMLNDWGMAFKVGREVWIVLSWDTDKIDPKTQKPYVNVIDFGPTEASVSKKFETVVIPGLANPFIGRALGDKLSSKVTVVSMEGSHGESIGATGHGGDEIPF